MIKQFSILNSGRNLAKFPKVLQTAIGMGTIASILILLADSVWLTHDIITNGFSFTYLFIFIIFNIGYGLLSYSLFIHHKAINKAPVAVYIYDNDFGGRHGD